ncbi:DUF4913 domain-containing protein [Nocardia puris]|uniref:DUF4913 domain-containing protein n=1 Tax=Nocardia puris TaxID=208602 RepID=UPI0018937292|nr:DUF4913 domain-containing protein [Nocardia puris]MBF6215963.1 DUF4913 domain-containing protein [Nocardia puris]
MTTPGTPPPPPLYRDYAHFATDWLLPMYTVRLAESHRENTYTWCTDWWRHRPVTVRIAHLHRAFEATRRSTSGTALNTFILATIDPVMRYITDAANGPLHRCTRTHHTPFPSLTSTPPPPNWFTTPKPPPATDPDHTPRYQHFAHFVTDWLLPITALRTTGRGREGQYTWCRQWWRHRAVAIRFAAIHRAFEAARKSTDPTAMITLITKHIDPQTRTILDAANGPLHRCTPDSHTDLPGLPTTTIPPTWLETPHSPPETHGWGPDFRTTPQERTAP